MSSEQPKPLAEVRKHALAVHRRLLDRFGNPEWRNPLPPLDELVSTILSQNTNDTNRDRAFQSLRERFPSWEAVRDADEADVIDAIRTAGLANQKGPRIQAILRELSERNRGLDLGFLADMPAEAGREWLQQFKGVGPKTAAIVLLFSLGKPAFPVDTHVHRVTGRLGLRPGKMSADKAHDYLADVFPADSYYAAHLNLIRLGREICHARGPECPLCPLQVLCAYYQKSQSKANDE